jgi:glycosyltransferase involved in cell wall biosynthesis
MTVAGEGLQSVLRQSMATPLSGAYVVKVTRRLRAGEGLARALLAYCDALRSLGARVEVVVVEQPGAPCLEEAGFATHLLDAPRFSHCLGTSRALAALLADLAPDWVHAHGYELIIHACRARARGNRAPLLATHHDARHRWSRRLVSLPYGRVPDRILSPSTGAARVHQRWYHYPPERMAVLTQPVAPAFFDLPARDPAVGEELGLAGAYPVAIWPARFQRLKGHADLLQAWSEVIAGYPEAKLVLAGDGKLQPAMRSLADHLGLARSVVFAGFRQDLPAMLSWADMLVCPSHAETLCLSVLEAMAGGVPVVSTRVWGPDEHIRDGENGFLVPIGSSAALAGAIKRVAGDRDLAQGLGRAGRTYARDHFTQDSFTAALGRIYAGD